MEQFEFNYTSRRKVPKRSHVGVVGSGDLEVLLEPQTMRKPRCLSGLVLMALNLRGKQCWTIFLAGMTVRLALR